LAVYLEPAELPLKNLVKRYGFLFLIAGGIILLDQITKYAIRAQYGIWSVGGPWSVLGVDVFLVHMPNTGMMLGLFQGAGSIITVIGLAIIGILVYYFPKISRQNGLARWGIALLLGGILGNLIDRVFLGYITDFVRIDPLPVFNIADIAVYTGVILIAISVLFDSKRKESQSTPAVDSEK
jgi:signal peptidase II